MPKRPIIGIKKPALRNAHREIANGYGSYRPFRLHRIQGLHKKAGSDVACCRCNRSGPFFASSARGQDDTSAWGPVAGRCRIAETD